MGAGRQIAIFLACVGEKEAILRLVIWKRAPAKNNQVYQWTFGENK